MKFLILVLLSLFFVISCDNEEKTKTCNPSCDEWKTCNVNKCELTDGRCMENGDCKDSAKPICDNHNCVEETVVECSPTCDATWQECTNGECVPLDGKCTDNTECKDSTKPICEDHECIEEDPSCGDLGECPEGRHCEYKEGFGEVCKYNKPENTYTRCTDGYDNDQNGHKDCDDWECQKLDVCAPKCDNVECSDGKVCDPDTGDCVTIEIQTIKQVRDAHVDGALYKTKGIIVAKDKDGLYIQDESERGIYVYINPGTDGVIGQVIGDEITVAGSFKDFFGLAELTTPTISNVTHNNTLPDFKLVDAADILTFDIYESMLVKFKNNPFTVTIANQSGGPNSILEDSNNKEFTIRNNIYPFEIVDGDILTKVQGVLGCTKDKFKLFPRNENDIALLGFTCTPACDESSEICVRDHDEVGKCETACDPACDNIYEACITDGGESSCQMIEGMCYIDDKGTDRVTDDEVVGCDPHYNCIDNFCIEAINSVPNGDLESWEDDNTATGWTYEYDNQAHTVVYKETNSNFVCEGLTSAKVRKTRGEDNTSNKKNEFYSPAFPIDATTTKKYNISVQIIDNDPNVKAKVFWKFYGATGHNVETDGTEHSLGRYSIDFDGCRTEEKTNNWSIFAGLTDDEKAAVRTIKIGVRLYDQDSSDEGFIYVDDFRIEEIETK